MSDIDTTPDDTEEEATEVKFTFNPQLVLMMTKAAMDTLDEEEDESVTVADVVYLTVKTFLQTPQVRGEIEDMVPAIFPYYLEISKYVIAEREKREDNGHIVTEAALALFPLYAASPSDHILRQCVGLAAMGIHQILEAYYIERTDAKMRTIAGHLGTVQVLCDSVRKYVAGSHRKENIPYINWVHKTLTAVVGDTDFTYFQDTAVQDEVRLVMSQLSGGAKVIDMTPKPKKA